MGPLVQDWTMQLEMQRIKVLSSLLQPVIAVLMLMVIHLLAQVIMPMFIRCQQLIINIRWRLGPIGMILTVGMMLMSRHLV